MFVRSGSMFLGCLLVLALSPFLCSAGSLSAAVTDVTTITNEASESRILFRIPELASFEANTFHLKRATLRVPYFLGDALDERVVVVAYAMTRSWGAGAEWNAGWERAGGDFDAELFATVEVARGARSGTLEFDLTSVVRELVANPGSNQGFLLSDRFNRDGGIRQEEIGLLNSLGEGVLVVSYKETLGSPRRGRSR